MGVWGAIFYREILVKVAKSKYHRLVSGAYFVSTKADTAHGTLLKLRLGGSGKLTGFVLT